MSLFERYIASLGKPSAIRNFRLFLLVAIVLFLVVYLRGIDWQRLGGLQLAWPPLVASAVLSLSFRYWGVYIWRGILQDLGSRDLPPFSLLATIYAQSWMARYIPGAVTWMSSRVILAQGLGISKSRLAAASLVEAVIQMVAIAATSMLLLSIDDRMLAAIGSNARWLVLLAGLALMLLLIPAVFNRIIRRLYRLLRRRDAYDEFSTNARATLRSFARYAVGSLVSGLSYYFVARAVWGQALPGDLLFIIAAVNLAAVLGMLTPFVPGGLGVRDTGLLVLLSVIFPREAALAITVFSRLWSVAIDLLFFQLASLSHRFSNAKE